MSCQGTGLHSEAFRSYIKELKVALFVFEEGCSDSHSNLLATVQTRNSWQALANVQGRKDEVQG